MGNTFRPIILITEPHQYNKQALAIYESVGTVILGSEVQNKLMQQLTEAEIVVVRLGIQFGSTLLQNPAKKILAIVSPTTGLNHIDLDAAASKQIQILSLQGETNFLESIPSTAEFTWGLILEANRNIIDAANSVAVAQWNRDLFKGKNLRGKTIGIIGLGRVGKQVAHFANAFGMNVLAYDTDKNIVGADYVSMLPTVVDLVSASDIVTIHIPSQNNDHFINKDILKKCKQGSIWINTSRANVWDEAAIASLVKSGHIGKVATDVLSHENKEQPIQNNPLWIAAQEDSRIIITPHLAGATEESMLVTELFMAEKFRDWHYKNINQIS
jgi:D-3-phosphoglycerate dehydrogenase